MRRKIWRFGFEIHRPFRLVILFWRWSWTFGN